MSVRPIPLAAAALFALFTAAAPAEDHFPPMILHAGPISLEFAEGQLRYLCVGEREIVRRIYFAVRDDQWGTIAPVFSVSEIKNDGESFAIQLEARCQSDKVDFSWKGKVTGSATGEIVFDVEGTANKEFRSNRIGLCLLYGAEAVAGQKFEVINESGGHVDGEFPRLVSPKLLAAKYRQLQYVTPNLMQLRTALEGSLFSMEDQRNFGDSSYKAYAPLDYKYPIVPADASAHQRLALTVLGANRGADRKPGIRIHLGDPIREAKIPQIVPSTAGAEPLDFVALNAHRDNYAGQKTITFRFNPTTHLRDDEMIMENTSAVIDEVKTVRSFAPEASVHVDPAGFNSKVRGAPTDPRSEQPFGAAWSAVMIRDLALAGVEQVGFAVEGEPAKAIQGELGHYAGAVLLETVVDAPYPAPIAGLAIETAGKRLLWLINRTGDAQDFDFPESRVQPPLQPWEVRLIELPRP